MCDVLSKDIKKSVRSNFENTKIKNLSSSKTNSEKQLKVNQSETNIEIPKISENEEKNSKSFETNSIMVEDLDNEFKSLNSSSKILNQELDSERENFIKFN
jgi:hypothetical protein